MHMVRSDRPSSHFQPNSCLYDHDHDGDQDQDFDYGYSVAYSMIQSIHIPSISLQTHFDSSPCTNAIYAHPIISVNLSPSTRTQNQLTSSFEIVTKSPGAALRPVTALTATSTARPTAPRVATQ